MSRRPIEPHSMGGGPATPYLVLGLAWTAIAVVWLAWAAGRLAATLSGTRARGPDFGAEFVAALLRTDWHTAWPGINPVLVAAVYALLLTLTIGTGGAAWWRWQAQRPDGDDPLPSLAHTRDIATLTADAVAQRARRLAPSLAATPRSLIRPGQAGVALGTHARRRRKRGPVLYASLEDVIVAVMAPRAGKTTTLTVPAVLDAPGPVIATSNKPDLWTTTSAARARRGRVWVFDPQAITYQPQTWWWNPLHLTRTWEDAYRLADHFITQIRADSHSGEDFWALAAHDLLTCFLLAAACDRGTLADVQSWLSDATSREPGRILAGHGFHAAARNIAGRQAGAPETRDGVYETARTAASCLSDPQIMAWVTPPTSDLSTLDVARFPESADTIYLLSKDGAGSAAPLVAGLTDQLLRAAVRTAETRGGRLDPVLLAVLDEAANICRISDLPQLYSHFGSRGIIPMTILQSYPQGARVWGEQGMAALWSAATIKLIGAGIDDPKLAEDLSRLVGEHDVPLVSRTRDGSGHHTWQTSVRRQRILDPAQVRAIHRGHALLLATGIPAAMIRLLPWYDGPHAAELNQAVTDATDQITHRARRSERS